MRERGRGDWRRVVTGAIAAARPASEAFQRGGTGMGRRGANQRADRLDWPYPFPL